MTVWLRAGAPYLDQESLELRYICLSQELGFKGVPHHTPQVKMASDLSLDQDLHPYS